MARESERLGGGARWLGTGGGLTQPAPAVSFGPTQGIQGRLGTPMTAAFTFPGQGSQAVGMGKALAEAFPAARAVFDEVDAALGEKLTTVIWDGPAETLQLTENAQPALMAVSIATLRVLETEAGFSVGRDAAFVAGHSLGEYSALAAAGSLSISDTARLLRIRGLAMQKAVPVGVGAMAALLGLDYEAAVAGCGLRRQGRGRTCVGNCQNQGRQARDVAAGVGAVSLPADAARGRCDGQGAGRCHHQATGFAIGVERAGRVDYRSWRDPPPPDRTGYRNRALA